MESGPYSRRSDSHPGGHLSGWAVNEAPARSKLKKDGSRSGLGTARGKRYQYGPAKDMLMS